MSGNLHTLTRSPLWGDVAAGSENAAMAAALLLSSVYELF